MPFRLARMAGSIGGRRTQQRPSSPTARGLSGLSLCASAKNVLPQPSQRTCPPLHGWARVTLPHDGHR